MAGIPLCRANVRYWHKADITALLIHVRFWGKADMTRQQGLSHTLALMEANAA